MYLDGERVGGAARREGAASQEDGRLVTVIVDGDLDIVIGVFRDITKVVDGAIEVSIYSQGLVFCEYSAGVCPESRKILLTSPAETVVGDTITMPYWEASAQL